MQTQDDDLRVLPPRFAEDSILQAIPESEYDPDKHLLAQSIYALESGDLVLVMANVAGRQPVLYPINKETELWMYHAVGVICESYPELSFDVRVHLSTKGGMCETMIYVTFKDRVDQ